MNPPLTLSIDPRVAAGYAILVAVTVWLYHRARTRRARLAVYALAVIAVTLFLLFFAPR